VPASNTFDSTDTDLRRLIQRVMDERGTTQTELAEATGTQQRQVSEFLARKLDPRLSTVEAWMTYLGIRAIES
jgi:predicted transcriptional regulator